MAKNKKPQPITEPTTKIVTQEDLDNNPSLVEQGVNVGDEITIPAPVEVVTEMDAEMQPYLDAYPNADSFFRTTDNQVFLSENLAAAHQKTIADGENFQTFKRN